MHIGNGVERVPVEDGATDEGGFFGADSFGNDCGLMQQRCVELQVTGCKRVGVSQVKLNFKQKIADRCVRRRNYQLRDYSNLST